MTDLGNQGKTWMYLSTITIIESISTQTFENPLNIENSNLLQYSSYLCHNNIIRTNIMKIFKHESAIAIVTNTTTSHFPPIPYNCPITNNF